DKLLNYNSRLGRWDITSMRIRSVFDTHNFGMVWSYGEMAPLITGLGFDWTIEQTAKCIEELIELTNNNASPLLDTAWPKRTAATTTCKNAARLDQISDASVDAVVIDPPYGANVMYAELSDFFYVWLKRTAGLVYPELFRAQLTDKQQEAVENPGRFDGQPGAAALA